MIFLDLKCSVTRYVFLSGGLQVVVVVVVQYIARDWYWILKDWILMTYG